MGDGARQLQMRCWSCGRDLAADHHYCPYCAQGQGAFLGWYYRPVWIAVLTLTVLGPFALPLVWRTPRLGRVGKAIATLLVLALTAYVGWRLAATIEDLEQLFEV